MACGGNEAVWPWWAFCERGVSRQGASQTSKRAFELCRYAIPQDPKTIKAGVDGSRMAASMRPCNVQYMDWLPNQSNTLLVQWGSD